MERDYLSNQEIADFTAEVSMDRIQKKIEEETGLSAGALLVVTKRRRRTSKLTSVAAAIAILLVGSAVVYAWQGGYLASFFGADSQFPVAQVIAPGDSIVEDGLIITLEEILPGEDGGIIAVSYQWEDGRPFAKTTWVGTMDFRVSSENNYQSGASDQLLDGGKRLVWYYEFSNVPLIGETLTISGDTLYTRTFEELPLSFTLADYFAATGHVFTLAEAEVMRDTLSESASLFGADRDIPESGYLVDQLPVIEANWVSQWLRQSAPSADTADLEVAIPLQEQVPDFQLGGMILIEDSLYIANQDDSPATEKYYTQNRAAINQLLDTRTGETIYASGSEGYVYFFSGIKTADLPHLIPLVSYEIYDVLSEAEWEFACRIEDEGQLRRLALTDVLPAQPLEEGAVQLTEAILSPLGLTIHGRHLEDINNMGVPPYKPETALVLSDGTVQDLQWVGGHADNMWDFTYRYQLYSEPAASAGDDAAEGQRLFFSSETLNAVEFLVIDGDKVPLQ